MPTLALQVIDGNDTGFSQGTVWTAALLIGGHSTPNPCSIGIRWQNVTVPQGATLSSASLHVRARNLIGTPTNIHFKIRGHKGDAPQWAEGVFEPDLNFTATTAQPDYDPAVWVVDDYYDVDVTTVVQEIINDGGWVSGFDLALVFFDDGSVTDNNLQMYRVSDGDTTAQVLTITYSSGVGPVVPPFLTTVDVRRL